MKKVKALAAIISCVYGSVCFANFEIGPQLKIGPEYIHYSYREPSIQKRPLNRGTLYGVNAAFRYDRERFFVNFESKFLKGSGKYSGKSFVTRRRGGRIERSETELHYKTSENKLVESRGTFGIKTNDFGFYSGIGMRELKITSPNVSGTVKRYKRKTTNYLYFPVGASGSFYENNDDFNIFWMAEYDHLIRGSIKTKRFSNKSSWKTNNFNQNNGFGLKLLLALKIKSFEISPFFNFWSVRASKPKSYKTQMGARTYEVTSIEPKSTTREFGIRANFVF